MQPHPYKDAPPHRLWRRAISGQAPSDIDPVVAPKFRVTQADRIVTAGSCFAQHIARRLGALGFHHFVTESPHPLLDSATANKFQYGIYSARWGNIYTPRQLLQLQQRALGRFGPAEDVWTEDERFFDPFRPAIQPGGFASAREFTLQRERHFAAVRRAFAEMDVLIFTLGLTEAWESTRDGAVFPTCPGTIAGRFDPATHRLRLLGVEDIVADFRTFLAGARRDNPNFRTILTVSPVPLAATALDRHVLEATTLAKSTLRVAAEILAADPAVMYFPSYEIITGAFSRGQYFGPDLRAVTEAGVDHVMRIFASRVLADAGALAAEPLPAQDGFEAAQCLVGVICEEESQS